MTTFNEQHITNKHGGIKRSGKGKARRAQEWRNIVQVRISKKQNKSNWQDEVLMKCIISVSRK